MRSPCLPSPARSEYRPGGFAPSVVLQGRVYHRVGPLQTRSGKVPAFAQLYVCDPSTPEDEAALRLQRSRLNQNTTEPQRATLEGVMLELQSELREHHAYIADFTSIADMDDGTLEEHRCVIDPA